MRHTFATTLAAAVLCLLAGDVAFGAAKESLPAGANVVALEAQPKAIELKHKYDYRQLLLTAKLASGETLDVTRIAERQVPLELAVISDTGVVRPKGDGTGQATFTIGGQTAKVPLTVLGQTAEYHVSFVRDVMPVLSKMGCNAGTCHGSLNGKNGFKLSLRGYDPLYDHRALTDDIAGRRFNRAAPDQSLMLLKPSGVIPHVGGVLTHSGEPYYETIRSWIASGVKLDLDSPRVTKIEVLPANPVVPLPGMKQQMTVMATYSDGSVRDVSLEAFVESGNTEVAESNKAGLITMIRRGEAPVLARFEGSYAATTITVMGDRSGFEWQQPPANNYVDELVYQKLKRVKTLPSDLCTDAEFIRRVWIDLTGIPPTSEDVRAFLADSRDTQVKRDELVDRLVGSGDYVEYWANKWGDLLQVNRKFLGETGAAALRGWIKQAVASNMPYDEFVRTVLTASGSTIENPPAAYYKVLRAPEETMENTTQLFLAVRFNCNKCHDHPFERWTQNQYYHLSAYFAQVGRKEDPAGGGAKLRGGGEDIDGPVPMIEDIYDSGKGDVKHAGTGKVTPPAFPYEHEDKAAADLPRRVQLAHWLTSPRNQYFAKSYVNRLWGYLFGRGIIEPIDDIRAGNPPTNPELLDRLTSEFIKSGFNTQEILRTICKSRTYQHSIVANKWNQDDDINFSHASARRLPAEVMYDALMRATGATSRLPGVPAGYRAVQLPDVGLTLPSGFFEAFGRPARESSCECERSSGMMLGPVMALINGPTIADAIADKNNAITKLVSTNSDDERVVEEIFVRTLCRIPTAEEVKAGVEAMRATDNEHEKNLAALAAHEKELDAEQVKWEAAQQPVSWAPLDPSEMKSLAGASFEKQPDMSVKVGGPLSKDTYTITCTTDARDITGFRLEVLADPSLPGGGPGRAPNGNFVLNELRIFAAPKGEPEKKIQLSVSRSEADTFLMGYRPNHAVDNNIATGWSLALKNGKSGQSVYEVPGNVGFEAGTILTFIMEQQHRDGHHAIGKFRLSTTTSPRPIVLYRQSQEIDAIVAIPAEKRSDAQKAELAAFFRSLDDDWLRLKRAADASAAQTGNKRLLGAQDLAWALINSPAFLFNR